MRFNLLPQEERFFEDFNHQASLIAQSARALREMVENFGGHAEKLKRIADLEHESDEIVHMVATRLNKTFVTPIDREDIHALANCLDDVLDYIQGAGVRMDLFRIQSATPHVIQQVTILEKAADVIVQGVEQLPTFKDITPLAKQMQALEKQGDQMYRVALADLFYDGADPLNILKWKDIYDIIETAIDKCEDIFDVLEGIVLKHA